MKGSSLPALITLLFVFFLLIFKTSIITFLGINTFEVILGTLLGGTGAWFSILRRTAKIKMDPTAGPFIHYIESASRVLVGNIGAFIIALSIKGNILLGFLKSTDYSFPLLIVVCIIAGVSEELVPGFIRQFENSFVSDREESG